jgi:hypothetical protein
MIEVARRRNREHIEAGRARLDAVALEDAELGKRRFDKVFAFNVAPFWLEPEAALGVVRKHLAKDGIFYLFPALGVRARHGGRLGCALRSTRYFGRSARPLRRRENSHWQGRPGSGYRLGMRTETERTR